MFLLEFLGKDLELDLKTNHHGPTKFVHGQSHLDLGQRRQSNRRQVLRSAFSHGQRTKRIRKVGVRQDEQSERRDNHVGQLNDRLS